MKIRIVMVVVLFFFILSGCSTKVGYMGSNVGNRINGSYHLFTGKEIKKVSWTKREIFTVNCSSVVKKGTLNITLLNSQGETVKKFPTGSKIEQQINVTSTGKYEFVIQGTNTEGNFSLSWKKVNS